MGVTVYSITHRETGRQYVGLTSNLARRLREHRRTSLRGRSHIRRAIALYGFEAFDVREEAQLPSRAEAAIAERLLIAIRKPAFNITAGGEGTIGIQRAHSHETRAKIAASLTGRKASEATRAKLRGRIPHNLGVPMSDAQRAKLAASKLGKKPSAEIVARRAESGRRYWRSPEGRARAREFAERRWRPVCR